MLDFPGFFSPWVGAPEFNHSWALLTLDDVLGYVAKPALATMCAPPKLALLDEVMSHCFECLFSSLCISDAPLCITFIRCYNLFWLFFDNGYHSLSDKP